VTIWQVLVAACFAVPVGAALVAAEAAKAGLRGHLSAILVASIVGISFALSMRLVHRRLFDIFQHSPSTLFSRFLIALFVAECAWIGTGGAAAWWTAAELLHRMH
jgi:hypothetical protein